MERNRKCILCETVHTSKREMDEHMRSMLHHRELEKLKGRDCGHECRVCKITVVSLTDYASHISSPVHKQNVEASEHGLAGNDQDYFDQVLVDLIEKRKEKIRKEKEAAAKLAKEEEDRKRKELQKELQRKRLQEAKERYWLNGTWQNPSQGFSGSSPQRSWFSNRRYDARDEEARPWNHDKQGKSATWHAQEPPNFQRWASGGFAGGSLNSQRGWGSEHRDQVAFSGYQRNRLPWLSNGGSSHGLYGRNNISQNPVRGRPPSMYPSPPNLFAPSPNQFKNTGSDQGSQWGDRLQNREEPTAELDHNGSKSSKNFGSNPKLDKSCRWSPYPVTKGSEAGSHKDTQQNSLEKCSSVHKPQRQETAPEPDVSKRKSRLEQKPRPLISSVPNPVEEVGHKKNPTAEPRDESSSSSRSSSAQRDDHESSASGSSNQRANKPTLHRSQKKPSNSGVSCVAHLNKPSGPVQAKSNPKQSGLHPQVPQSGPVQSKKELQLPEMLDKARQIVSERKSSLDSCRKNMVEIAQIGGNNESNYRQNAAKSKFPDSVRPEKQAFQSSDSSQFLQSLQVSTSTMESSESAASNRKDKGNKNKITSAEAAALQKAIQAVEAVQSSESDTSKSVEAGQPLSVSHTSSFSKLDLPPGLKRDLTKHISSKSKPGNHEPNLNIARRVRNLSESRRSDTEKDSGLKPTVRQLISTSGSRRNVNWDQVYHEVRKKQDKGKGMPRFGIEMVPLDQEDQSQEEDDIRLLEGFHWDSMMDTSSSVPTRKRSLSESSLAPTSTHSPPMPKETPEMVNVNSLISVKRESSVSPGPVLDVGNKDEWRHRQTEQVLGKFSAKAQKQPDKLTSAAMEVLLGSDAAMGDSSSGTEQCDDQGTGKRRRKTMDVQSAETSFLEHNNKRRKLKSKKDRLQIDELLAVSLREDELCRSLQTMDTSLIQARAALQAAYMEVQRLMVAKEQMIAEMNSLRNKRIELLKGMQGSREEAPQAKQKEARMDSVEAVLHTPSIIPSPSLADGAAAPSLHPPAECAPPLSPSIPLTIKQEPQSPVHVSSDQDAAGDTTHVAHSTTPELHDAPPAASSPAPVHDLQLSPERIQPCKAKYDWENVGGRAETRESLSGLAETNDKAIQTSRSCPPPDLKPSIKVLSASRRDSDVARVVDCVDTKSLLPPPAPPAINTPASPSEVRNGKRVRKLKKRKVLKKAQGTEQPESSDTELDGEAMRLRLVKPRRRSSGSSQVSTSTQPSEDRDVCVHAEGGKEISKKQLPVVKPEKIDSKSAKCMVELPQMAPAELTVTVDSEESMDVPPASLTPHMEACSPPQIPDTTRQDPQSLACNEVTSTSDMDICKSSDSDVQGAIILTKTSQMSSDVSSDHGEDALPSEGAFEGHQEAVNSMHIHNGILYTCSGDRTVKAFDLVSHECVGVFEGHTSKVSCLLVSAAPSLHHRLYSGSSDQTIRCYRLKTGELEQQFSLADRVLCLHNRWKSLYAGLANGTVVTFDLKTNKQVDVFDCHGPRAVSCLASTQEGARRILLVGSYDSTISVRDAKNGLLLRSLEGHTKTVLCMKVVNDLVFSGSSDQCVYTHNVHTGELVRVYKGHSHAVTVVTVLGKVMVTACLDKLVRVYDLQSQELLQVYGGHKDMVMCMAVHKNMIYTGCYDGSVQAVKLNLLQKHRCWWHGCSLVFGMMEHLQLHLINDHAGAKSQTLKCRWKSCEEFFSSRTSSTQVMLVHMQKHAEEELELEP
ncbi:zinc finger protein 106 [Antennarius striatus]|uniref:zinc finger protein 106 n=1 Tax=Antennarius striatus TaxID=241820 RepID=UPI0035B058D3